MAYVCRCGRGIAMTKKRRKMKAARTDAGITRALQRRARKRVCECTRCLAGTPCGWAQGLLLSEHSPEKIGMRLEGRELPDGSPVFVFVEVERGERFRDDVREVISALAKHMVLVVADVRGDVDSVLGPTEQSEAVIRTLGVDPEELEQPWDD